MPQKPQNYLNFLPLLVGLVIVFLLILYFIPSEWIDKYQLRTIDILADVRSGGTPENLTLTDTAFVPEPPRLDTCRTGLTCLEDYSSEGNAIDHFLNALGSIDSLKRPVRIAYFGDSFIEGDILCGDLRAKLQSQFGGKGVGMMPLSSQSAGFRPTIIQRSSKWTNYSLIDHKRNDLLGISGNVFIPEEGASVYYGGVDKIANLDTFQRVSIYYSLSNGEATASYQVNKQETKFINLTSSEQIQRYDITPGNCGNISIRFPNTGDLALYGVSLEDTTGVIVDNFAMRSSAGWVLKHIPQKNLKGFNQLVQYDLIILEFGLNVMEAGKVKYSTFTKEMTTAVNYLKECFPATDFLLIGVSDRSTNNSGQYVTMPAVHGMIAAQKKICADTGIAFWNLFEAMGGENSMVDFATSKPPKANKDYTHLTFKGGDFLANKLFETITYEKERYEKKKEYQLSLQKR